MIELKQSPGNHYVIIHHHPGEGEAVDTVEEAAVAWYEVTGILDDHVAQEFMIIIA